MKTETDELLTISEDEETIAIDKEKVKVTRIAPGAKASAEHRRISNFLGLPNAEPITQEQLEKYLADNCYEVYPLSSVEKFMNAKVAKEPKVKTSNGYRTATVSTKWRWAPIRKGQTKTVTNSYYPRTTTKILYDQPIPVEVLMTVEKIFRDLGDQVTFEVTQVYKHKKVVNFDPFLCVTAPGCPKYVIERWDEPAFRR